MILSPLTDEEKLVDSHVIPESKEMIEINIKSFPSNSSIHH